MINICKLDKKMLLKVFCVILLTSLKIASGTNVEQNRQVVYEKCRGPSESTFLTILFTLLKLTSKVNLAHVKTFSTNGALMSHHKNAQHLSGAAVMETVRIALTLKLNVLHIASVEIVIENRSFSMFNTK